MTPGGARLLGERLAGPLTDPDAIRDRQDSVATLLDDGPLRDRLRRILKRSPDFARALWQNPDLKQMVERRTPLGRIGDPDDIAPLAALLCSPAGSFITGQVLVADGGVTIAAAW